LRPAPANRPARIGRRRGIAEQPIEQSALGATARLVAIAITGPRIEIVEIGRHLSLSVLVWSCFPWYIRREY
jgi:hypothetical protein